MPSAPIPASALSVSPDGYIRLALEQFQSLPLVHHISGMDEHGEEHTSATTLTGYTEWTSQGRPAITLGWDWQMVSDGAQPTLRRINEPRSNLMLMDPSRIRDLGQEKTTVLLIDYVDKIVWQGGAMACLKARYQP